MKNHADIWDLDETSGKNVPEAGMTSFLLNKHSVASLVTFFIQWFTSRFLPGQMKLSSLS